MKYPGHAQEGLIGVAATPVAPQPGNRMGDGVREQGGGIQKLSSNAKAARERRFG
jgi:hypothetical protein